MAIAFVASGAQATGSISLSVAYPAGLASGNLLLLCISNKYPTNGPSTPSGWTLVAQKSGGVGASGADSGQVYSTVFSKVADGTESGNLSVTLTSANSAVGRMLCYSNATGGWDIASTTDDDTVASTSLSFTYPANPGVTAGDYIATCAAANGTSATYSSPSFTQTGITFGTATQRNGAGTITGDNCDLIIYDVPVNSGTGSGNPVHSTTANTTFGNYPAGAECFVRLREAAAGPTTYTLDANAATYTTAMSSADLLRTYVTEASPASYSISLASADLLRTYALDADPAAMTIAVADAELVYIPNSTPVVVPSGSGGGGGNRGWDKREWKKKKSLQTAIEETLDNLGAPAPAAMLQEAPARPFISTDAVATLAKAMLPKPPEVPKVRVKFKKVQKPQPVIEEDDYDDEELGLIALLAG